MHVQNATTSCRNSVLLLAPYFSHHKSTSLFSKAAFAKALTLRKGFAIKLYFTTVSFFSNTLSGALADLSVSR